EDLRGGLGGALCKSLSHEVGAGLGQGTGGPALRDCAERANSQRDSEDSEVVVVRLITKANVADLVQTLELVEADGIAVRHDEPMEGYGETRLAKRVHLFGFAEDF